MKNHNNKKQLYFAFFLFIIIFSFVYWVIASFIGWLSTLNPDLVLGLLTAATTIIVAAVTITLGRYFERVKETESHLRAKKIEIYDSFLKELFAMYGQEKKGKRTNDLTIFLKEWQRKLIVWGGPEVLRAYISWSNHLTSCEPNAQSVLLMDIFFRAMRKDIGLSNKNLEKGIFCFFILRNWRLFLNETKINPSITLAEFSEKEENLGL